MTRRLVRVCCAEHPIHIAVLVPLVGSWADGAGIVGAVELAIEKVKADKSLLPRQLSKTLKDRRCDRDLNLNLKVCDKDGDGGVNKNQGSCSMAECEALCEAQAAEFPTILQFQVLPFSCKYYAYEPSDGECFVFNACKKPVKKVGYATYPVEGSVGFVLEYSFADSGCTAKQGLAAMGGLLGSIDIHAVIGPGCSSASCEVTSFLSAGSSIPQISWGCTSPTLSNKNEYQLVRGSIESMLECFAFQTKLKSGKFVLCHSFREPLRRRRASNRQDNRDNRRDNHNNR